MFLSHRRRIFGWVHVATPIFALSVALVGTAAQAVHATKVRPLAEARFKKAEKKLHLEMDGTSLTVLEKAGNTTTVDPAFEVAMGQGGMWKVTKRDHPDAVWIVLHGDPGSAGGVRSYYVFYKTSASNSKETLLYTDGRPTFMRDGDGVDWATGWIRLFRSHALGDQASALEVPFVGYQYNKADNVRVTGYTEIYHPDLVAGMGLRKALLRFSDSEAELSLQAKNKTMVDDLYSANIQLVETLDSSSNKIAHRKVEYVRPDDLSSIVTSFDVLPKVLRWADGRFSSTQQRKEVWESKVRPFIQEAKRIIGTERELYKGVLAAFDLF